MASSNVVYQHKKFNLKSEEYVHKKFRAHCQKRKNVEMEDKENITAQTILDLTQKDKQTEIPAAKRRQTKALFRPWLNNEVEKTQELKTTSQTATVLNTISNISKPQKPRSSAKQYRVKRSITPAFIHHCNQQTVPFTWSPLQYAFYQQYQLALMQQQVRNTLYLRHLQMMILQRQEQQNQQLFVFGQQ